MFRVFKSMAKYIKPYKGILIFGTIITLLFSFLAPLDPYLTGHIIDGILTRNDTRFVIIGSLIIIGVTLFRTVLRYYFIMSFERLSQKIVYDLRKDLYAKLQALDFKYFDRTPNGQIMSKMTGDVEVIRHFFAWITHNTIFHGIVFFVAVVLMFTINPWLSLTLVLIIPFITFFSLRLSRSVKPMFAKIREQFSRLNTVVQENISGNRLVKAFAREDYEIKKFEIENEAFKSRNLEAARIWEKNLPVLEAVALMFNVVVLVLGGMMVIRNRMTIGELVAYNRLLWMINNPLRMLGWMINGTQDFMAAYERVKDILDQETTIKSPEKPLDVTHLEGYIRFEDVSFHYEDMPALENVTFSVNPGQTVALLGSTGSGKSTLTALISRFYDTTEGTIYIDDQPIQGYDIHVLRRNISIAMQDIFLFSDTIEGNIAYGVPEANKHRVQYAAEIAGVNEFIYKFEADYETIVGERGVGLSGGQRQRIALARAIIEDPSILILDDTTSAVDMETEYKILTELKKINEKRTTFIIAHRISSVKDADMILVMDEGRIIERGNHQMLLDQRGYYYDVYTQQMGEFDVEMEASL